MKHERNIGDVLQRALPSAPRGQMEAALDRVYARLQAEPESPRRRTLESATDVDHASRWGWWWKPLVASAAIAVAVWIGISARGERAYALLETSDGLVYRVADGERKPLRFGDRIRPEERIRTNGGAGSVFALSDGSRVEMRANSELTLELAEDGLRIRLNDGSIIVNAAKQRSGHLYVQTRDMTVSVVGTVFLVNAERDGSRVAVIEGEVRVREGRVEKRLRPGEQVATSPRLAAGPLTEAVSWSRLGNAYAAILAAFEKGMAQTSGQLRPLNETPDSFAAALGQAGAAAVSQEFEEASIRQCDPDNLPPTPEGARGGGANSFQMTPGRTYLLCMTLATIVRTAYGYGPANLDFLSGGRRGRGPNQLNVVYGLGVEDGVRVRGGPDWVRNERYTIEAVAGGPADADTMRGAMLQTLLASRFKLKAHIETEQVPAWTLTIASSGLKIKPVETDAVGKSGFVNTTVKDGGACEAQPTVAPGQPRIVRPAQPGERQPPPPSTPGQPVTILFRNFVDVRRGEKPTCGMSIQRNGPNQVIVAGGTTLEALARSLASPLGGVIVTDKTGNTDKFNIVLEFVRDENTPGPSFLTANQPEQSSEVPRGQTIFTALEGQLGLRLEPTKSPREFIVIDRVERPSPN